MIDKTQRAKDRKLVHELTKPEEEISRRKNGLPTIVSPMFVSPMFSRDILGVVRQQTPLASGLIPKSNWQLGKNIRKRGY